MAGRHTVIPENGKTLVSVLPAFVSCLAAQPSQSPGSWKPRPDRLLGHPCRKCFARITCIAFGVRYRLDK